MTDYSKITALYSRLSVGDEDRDGGESNSIQNQKIFLENYARGQHLTNIRHYIDDDESGRFFDRSAYSRMMDDVENGKIGVCIMKDLTRWGRDYLQVGNAMEIFRRNNVRFIAVNNGIDSEKPDTLEFAPFINIMSEWYAKDISKKVKTGIKTKGMSGKPIVTEAPYGYVKDPDNKDFWIIDEEAAEVVRLIFRLFIGGKNRNQIAVYLTQEQIPTPTFYMKDRGRGTCKNKTLNEDNRCKWNKATLTNIRHYIDDDESGRFFDRSAYSRMMDDVENGKIGVCIMKDLTRWGRDYLQVGNAMEIFRRNNVRFIAVNNGIDSEKPDTLEFAPFINIMSEWYAKDISKKVKTGIKTKGMSGKPIVTEAPYGYIKAPDNKDFWIIDEEAAEVVRLIFRLFLDGKNRNQIAVYLTQEQIPSPTFYMKDRGRGTCKNKTLNEDNRCKWNKATLTNILTRQEYCGDVVNFKTTKHFRDKHNRYVDRSQWHITENVHEPIISRSDFETVQRILENAPVRRPNGDGEIHPLSGLLFCKDCGAKMHIRIDYRNGGKRHVAFCSEYHKGKAKNPKCHSPHIMDADLLMQTITEVLKKIEDYSISNRAEFEALVKKNLVIQQTDQTKKQQKRIPQITTRLEQIDKVLNKLYEDNALGTIPQDR